MPRCSNQKNQILLFLLAPDQFGTSAKKDMTSLKKASYLKDLLYDF